MEEKQAEESTESLEKRRTDLVYQAGQKQFTKAVIDAELIQVNQEILNISNKLIAKNKEPIWNGKEVSPSERSENSETSL